MKYDPRGEMNVLFEVHANLGSLPSGMTPEQIEAFMVGVAKLIAIDCAPPPPTAEREVDG